MFSKSIGNHYRGPFLGLSQFLATKSPFKNNKTCFIFQFEGSFRS